MKHGAHRRLYGRLLISFYSYVSPSFHPEFTFHHGGEGGRFFSSFSYARITRRMPIFGAPPRMERSSCLYQRPISPTLFFHPPTSLNGIPSPSSPSSLSSSSWSFSASCEGEERPTAPVKEEMNTVHELINLFVGECAGWPYAERGSIHPSSSQEEEAPNFSQKNYGEKKRKTSATFSSSSPSSSPSESEHASPYGRHPSSFFNLLGMPPSLVSSSTSSSSSYSTVGHHILFLWKSACLRHLVPMPLLEVEARRTSAMRDQREDRQENSLLGPSPPPLRGIISPSLVALLLPMVHDLLLSSIQNGLDFAVLRGGGGGNIGRAPFALASATVAHSPNLEEKPKVCKMGRSHDHRQRQKGITQMNKKGEDAGDEEWMAPQPSPSASPSSSPCQWSSQNRQRLSRVCTISGSEKTCEHNIHLILTILLPHLLSHSTSASFQHHNENASLFHRSHPRPSLYSSFLTSRSSSTAKDAQQVEDILLFSLLLQPPSAPIPHEVINMVHQGSLDENLNSSSSSSPVLWVSLEDMLCFYFRHLRSSPISLSFAISLLSLSLLPISLLQCIMYRTLHDGFEAMRNSSPPLSTSEYASWTAMMFAAIVHALLNNDLFFTCRRRPHPHGTGEEGEGSPSLTPPPSPSPSSSPFFTALHQILLTEVLQAIPLWSSTSVVPCYYDYYAFTPPFMGPSSHGKQETRDGVQLDNDLPVFKNHREKKRGRRTGSMLHTRMSADGFGRLLDSCSSSSPSSFPFSTGRATSPSLFTPRSYEGRRKATSEGRGGERCPHSPSAHAATWFSRYVEDSQESRIFFRTFSRHVRWIPLLNKLSRVYTKNGRGMELMACQRALLSSVPEVEVQWPCSFYGRVMGAVMDTWKEQGDTAQVVQEGEEEGWCAIKKLGQRAVELHGPFSETTSPSSSVGRREGGGVKRKALRSAKDMNRIWIVLCKSALTLPPVSVGYRRLLEAYLTMVPKVNNSSTAAALSAATIPPFPWTRKEIYHVAASFSSPLISVDVSGLQQLMRLVRREMEEWSSCEGNAFSTPEEIIGKIEELFHLLLSFMIAYTPHSFSSSLPSGGTDLTSTHTPPPNHCTPDTKAGRTRYAWWQEWWVENGGFLLSDLWVCCTKQNATITEGRSGKEILVEAGKRIVKSFIGVMEEVILEGRITTTVRSASFSSSSPSSGGISSSHNTFPSILSDHAAWGSSIRCWFMEHHETTFIMQHPQESTGCRSPPMKKEEKQEASRPPQEKSTNDGSSSTSIVSPAPSALKDISMGWKYSSHSTSTITNSSTTSCSTSQNRSPLLHDQEEEEKERDQANARYPHCLLCGAEVIPPWKSLPRLPTSATPPSVLFFHCGVFQSFNEYKPFHCPCKESGGSLQVGYHCEYCFLPRPELHRGMDGGGPSDSTALRKEEDEEGESDFNNSCQTPCYRWQCVREETERRDSEGEDNSEGGDEEEQEGSGSTVKENVDPSCQFSLLCQAKQCGQWNYSWMSRCAKCGETRIKSFREPRVRNGPIRIDPLSTCFISPFSEPNGSPEGAENREVGALQNKGMYLSHESKRKKQENGSKNPSIATTDSSALSPTFLCSECGLPHISHQCPLFWHAE